MGWGRDGDGVTGSVSLGGKGEVSLRGQAVGHQECVGTFPIKGQIARHYRADWVVML